MTIGTVPWYQAPCSCACCNTTLLAERERAAVTTVLLRPNIKTTDSIAGFLEDHAISMIYIRYTYLDLQAWSNGGYSDDLIVAAKCGENSLSILCPSFTVFPQWCVLDADWICYSAPLRSLLK